MRIQQQVKKQNIKLTITDEALSRLSELGFDPQFGARPVKRVMQKQVLNELSKEILAKKVNKGEEIVLDVFNDAFVFRKPINEEEKAAIESLEE